MRDSPVISPLPALLASAAAAWAASSCAKPPLDVGGPLTVRGQQEVVLRAEGPPIPLFLGAGTAGLCFEVAPTADTSQWVAELRVDGRTLGAGAAPPAARMGRVLCFDGELPADLPAGVDLELCARVVDRFDGAVGRPPCQPLRQAESGAFRRLEERRRRLLRNSREMGLEAFLTQLDGLAADGRAASLPVFACRLTLVAVHFLRNEGTADARADARRRLDALPDWLRQPAASGLGAEAMRERAVLEQGELGGGSLVLAWQHLAEADRLARRIAYPRRFTVTMSQSDILARQGAVSEAADRMRAALRDCERSSCDERFLGAGHGQLSWLTLLDPQATAAELDEAGEGLRRALDDAADDPLEDANRMLNLAYLRLRQGRALDEPLEQARALLEQSAIGDEWARQLAGWADLIAGLGALAGGDPEGALRLCARVAERADPQLAAWTASCEGQARRLRGDLEGAARAFDQALERHELGSSRRAGTGLPLGYGPRADDFAHAARMAVELDRPEQAWERLGRLDDLAALESARQRCRDRPAPPEVREQQQSLDAESEQLFEELLRLEAPGSSSRRRALEPVGRSLRERLRHLSRQWPGCEALPPPVARSGYRAVALTDEILLLHRDASGRVSVARRTPFARRDLQRQVVEITAALAGRDVDDSTWRNLLLPLSQALVPPRADSLAPLTRFSLHGLLQGVPLAALPLAAGAPTDAPAWLGEVTTPVVVPAGAGRRPPAAETPEGPLFVVDPSGDLPGGKELLSFYRETFPQARVLAGREATREAFTRAVAGSRWLHVDAHGRYDSAFPELSGLELWDGTVAWLDLARLPVPRRFANLSGCQTGRWPFTADSGRFGIGGLLTRLGTRWVVASRSDLPDAAARDFNRVFYREVAGGAAVPAAYARALAGLRGGTRASTWASMLLLAAPAAEGLAASRRHPESENPQRIRLEGGQSPVVGTPFLVGRVSTGDPPPTSGVMHATTRGGR